jgi:phosphoglycerate dehydrogenase-like enzyme
MTTVVIATPVEPELVERIRAVDQRLEVLFDPELLPKPRYPSDHIGEPDWTRSAELERLLTRAEILYGFPQEKPAQLAWAVRSAPDLRFVQCTFAGAGQQVAAANLTPEELRRIAFASSSGVHATPLAEWSLFGILAFRKGLPQLQRDQRARHWAPHFPVDELDGATVLVVGLGAIGREVARLAEAFGMRVLSMRRNEGNLDELLPQADAIVVTLPLTRETRGLIDRRRVELMKPGAVFVNVGRGAVVDEDALADALRAGRLRGAALDVFAEEPLPETSPFWELENVIVSPHTAALSRHENERIVELFCENLRRYLAGEPLRSRIDTDLFY